MKHTKNIIDPNPTHHNPTFASPRRNDFIFEQQLPLSSA
jgi:hypothetical protein